jgi:hypothetical protein
MASQKFLAHVVAVLGIALLVPAGPALGGECPEYAGELAWPSSDDVRAVAVSNGLAYAASSGSLWIIDVSDPANPFGVGHAETPYYAEDVAVSDGYAYVATYPDGLLIFDVANPAEPVEAGRVATPQHPEAVAVSGNHVYVADRDDGLRIIDVSVPSDPDEVSLMGIPGQVRDVAVSNGLAYVTVDYPGRLRIIDISDPAHPVEVGSSRPYRDARFVWLAVNGNIAYVTMTHGLMIIDISDAAHPTEIALLRTEYRGRLIVSGGYAYVAAWSDGLGIIDVSDPSEPVEIGHVDTPGSARDVAVSDGLAYVGARYGVAIFDISDPLEPVANGRYREAPGIASAVVVSDGHAYVTTEFGLRNIDLSDPSSPVEVGHIDAASSANDVAVSGDHAYVATDDDVQIIDISDPANPVVIGAHDISGSAHGVVVSDGDAYIAADDGLRVIDVSNPTDPVESGFFDTPGPAHDVAVSGNEAFVAVNGGLLILDVSNPTDPVSVGSYETQDSIDAMAAADGYAYLVANAGHCSGALLTIDVSDPSYPVELGRANLPGLAHELTVSGGYAYVLVYCDRGVPGCPMRAYFAPHSVPVAVDVSNPTEPAVVAFGKWLFWARAVAVDDGFMYVAASGVAAYTIGCLGRRWLEMVAHTTGRAGTEWRTDLVALNTGTADANVETVLHTPDGAVIREHTVAAMSQRVFEDVVGSMGCTGKGTLEIRSDEPMTVIGDIYSQNRRGTFGQFVGGHGDDDGLGSGAVVRLLGLRQVAGQHRSNISVANTGVEPTQVQVTLHRTDGAEVSSYALEVQPRMVVHDLEPFRVRAGSPNLGWGFATVEVVSGSGVLVSASVIDSRSHDAITVPATPVTEDPSPPSYAVAASTSHAFLGTGDNLIVADLSQPFSPRVVGHVGLSGMAERITLSGTLAYVAAGEGGLRIIDVSSPGRPVEVGTFDGSGEAHDVAVSDGLAFLADGDGGLRLIDVSMPARPVEVGHYGRLGTRARGVAVSGHHALFVDDIGRLRILDVSTPSDPVVTGVLAWWDVTPHAEDVAVDGDHAYVAGCEAGVRIVDVSDLSAPVEVGSVETPGCATTVVVADGRAYVADQEGGLRIIDVSQPSEPSEVGFYETERNTADVWVSSHTVLLAEEDHGLEILRTDGTAVEQVSRYVVSSQPEWTSWLEIASHPPSWLGGDWETDVVALNESLFYAHVELVLHTGGGSLSITNNIPGGHQAVFQDVVGLMGRDGYGALEIRSDRPLAVSGAMTSGGDSGTCRRYLPGYRSPAGLETGEWAWLPGLRQSSGRYRTNISVTNTGADPAIVSVTLHSADGTELASYALEVGPGEVALDVEPYLFRALAPSVGWGFARMEVLSGSGILASASVHDERTSDAITIPMQR